MKPRFQFVLLTWLSLSTALSGCSSEPNNEPNEPNEPRNEPKIEPNEPHCPSGLSGPKLVELRSPWQSVMCIDETEVTVAQYAKFLGESKTKLASQSEVCEWNVSFEPFTTMPELEDPNDCGASDCSNYPRNFVDWCDAQAYCAWAGKHLCRRFPTVRNNPDLMKREYSDGTHEWAHACNAGQQTPNDSYPYGLTYDPTACNTESERAEPVKSRESCQGSGEFAGVFDLSGNLGEWLDECSPQEGRGSELDDCVVGGGDYEAGAVLQGEFVSCELSQRQSRYQEFDSIGFRCCADPL